ncbi:MAG: pyruvate kinase, partial [Candidatus Omnitrophota bacterium]
MKRTTIIATLGPATSRISVIEKLARAGADVFRMNFSHGEKESHRESVLKIREVERRIGRPVGILMDLQGPKIRVGNMPAGGIVLRNRQELTIRPGNFMGSETEIPTTYRNLPSDVRQGNTILIDDGNIELKVMEVKGRVVNCRVVSGGRVVSHKGINLPGAPVSAPSLTKKDLEDLSFGLELGVDFVAMSFVRHAEDVVKLRKYIKKAGHDLPVVAKLERPEAIDELEEILEVTDHVMIARGDLGVEMAPERVPEIQKSIIEKANMRGKGVITATQMLESMIKTKRPTRAEASDVANAVFDGSGGVMLSGETAVGAYPVEAVEMMARIVTEAEKRVMRRPMIEPSRHLRETAGFSGAVAYSAVRAARELDAKAIFTFTQSGTTALLVSKYRPKCPVIGATMHQNIARRMSLYWGVYAVVARKISSIKSLVGDVDEVLLGTRLVKRGG